MTEKKKQQNQRQMSEMTSQNTTNQPVNMVKRPNKTQNERDKLFARPHYNKCTRNLTTKQQRINNMTHK